MAFTSPSPPSIPDRNQNSLILLKKGLFTDVEEVRYFTNTFIPNPLWSCPILSDPTGKCFHPFLVQILPTLRLAIIKFVLCHGSTRR